MVQKWDTLDLKWKMIFSRKIVNYVMIEKNYLMIQKDWMKLNNQVIII